MHNSISNQRLEQRVPALNTTVKIRRRGLGFNPWRYDFDLIDLSANGMALSSQEAPLSPLQKIDFELRSGSVTTAGCAVICHLTVHGNKNRYGLLFIETDENFDPFLTGEYLSSDEVVRLGEEIAEQYMYQKIASDEVLFRVKNQRMIDSVWTMARRLGQMGLSIKNADGCVVSPEETLVINSQGRLSLPIIQETMDVNNLNSVRQMIIKNTEIVLVNDGDGNVCYKVDAGPEFANIIDFLNYLCASFDKMAAE